MKNSNNSIHVLLLLCLLANPYFDNIEFLPNPMAQSQRERFFFVQQALSPAAIFFETSPPIGREISARIRRHLSQAFNQKRITLFDFARRIRFRQPWSFAPAVIFQSANGMQSIAPKSLQLPKWQSPIFMMQANADGGDEGKDAEILAGNHFYEMRWPLSRQDILNFPSIELLASKENTPWRIEGAKIAHVNYGDIVDFPKPTDKVIFEGQSVYVIAHMPRNSSEGIILRIYETSGLGRTNFVAIVLKPNADEIDRISNNLFYGVHEELYGGKDPFSLRQKQFDHISAEASKRAAVMFSKDRAHPLVNYVWNLLKLPEVNKEDEEAIAYARSIEKKAEQEIEALFIQSKSVPPRRKLSAWNSNVITVGQRQMAVSQYAPGRLLERYIQTFGASTCVVCTFYDASVHKGAMIHIDGSTDIESSLAQISHLMRANPREITIHMIGGIGNQMHLRILRVLKKMNLESQIIHVEANEGTDSKAIILDLENGEVFDMTGIPFMDKDEIALMSYQALMSGPAILIRKGLATVSSGQLHMTWWDRNIKAILSFVIKDPPTWIINSIVSSTEPAMLMAAHFLTVGSCYDNLLIPGIALGFGASHAGQSYTFKAFATGWGLVVITLFRNAYMNSFYAYLTVAVAQFLINVVLSRGPKLLRFESPRDPVYLTAT